MAIMITFDYTGSQSQFDQIWHELRAIGQQDPKARLSHVACPNGTGMFVVDVWESQETFEAFGAHLMPIIQKVGGEVTHQVYPVYKMLSYQRDFTAETV